VKPPDEEAGVSRETRLTADWVHDATIDTGILLDPSSVERLERYLAFLATEATASGGIGPSEAERLLDRHLGDSFAFAPMLPNAFGEAIDVGSGVGLPGVPLAILYPRTSWVLLDRSGKRCHLLRRVVRMLELENATVVNADVHDFSGGFEAVTFRASLRPPEAGSAFLRLTSPTGVGVVALSRSPDRPDITVAVPGVATDVERLDLSILDSPAWFLRMRVT